MSVVAFDQTDPRRAYRQLFELGRGGMAKVYLAESLASGIRKLVVLKVLNPELSANAEMRALFRREAELAAQMNHPNVVQVMEVVEYRESPFIVMEYLDGAPLSTIIRRAGKHLSLALHLQILCQVLRGLHHFHELRDLDGSPLNGVHRDVSPQNIMVLHDGPVKVLDFGIAKISATDVQATRSGIIKGRIQYMPPEQILGASTIDRRADLFALGVILWEAVAGRRMWEGKTEVELFRALATGALPDLREFAPAAPDSIVRVVQRATAIEPERRFANALEMLAAIEEASAKEGLLTRSHELAAFMATHFGEAREEEQTQIRAALRGEVGSGAIEFSDSRQRLIPTDPTVESARTSDEPMELQVDSSRTFRVRRSSWGIAAGAAVLAALALVGTWVLRAPPPTAAVTAPVQPKTVMFEVQALPADAEIFLDGKLLATNHFSGPRPYAERKVSLEVRASGHVTERKELVLTRDMSLQIVLAADPAATVARAEAPVAAAMDSAVPSSRVAVQGNARTNKKVSAKCNPPYVFAADGVKTYKPECF
ncbi:MAG TPA: serine/threonine-protein kinase [Polyangiaceae bacterium]|nr:serine/threonine-protein kinase [Polyangiaceae bacterium]